MYKLCSIALAGFALAACAAAPPNPTAIGAPPPSPATATANSSADATPIAAAIVNVTPQPSSAAPIKALNMADFRDDGTRCEELSRPGSRIIVAKRCRTIIENEDAAFDQGVLSDQLNQVRRDQDEVTQARREQKELDPSARSKDSKGRGGAQESPK
jgi:hypothetical protein